jgi:omega-6 fatty acid desaturase (delta-12 desaturase)
MLDRAPTAKPPFTIGQLRKAVPSHCVERSTLRSASYLAVDWFLIGVFFYFTRYIVLLEFEEAAGDVVGISWALWMVYWTLQGCFCTRVWVIAHECGHHAFSDHQWLDDSIGLVLHSCLLIPYFSWKHFYRRHHSNTGSADRDEVFVPKKMEDVTLGAVMQYLQ